MSFLHSCDHRPPHICVTVQFYNPIQRWAINDRTQNLVPNSDGTVTLALAYAAPTDPIALANWLPVPVSE
jgi:hypothetical protein